MSVALIYTMRLEFRPNLYIFKVSISIFYVKLSITKQSTTTEAQAIEELRNLVEPSSTIRKKLSQGRLFCISVRYSSTVSQPDGAYMLLVVLSIVIIGKLRLACNKRLVPRLSPFGWMTNVATHEVAMHDWNLQSIPKVSETAYSRRLHKFEKKCFSQVSLDKHWNRYALNFRRRLNSFPFLRAFKEKTQLFSIYDAVYTIDTKSHFQN